MSHRTIYWPDPSWTETQGRARARGMSVSSYIRMFVEEGESDSEQSARETAGSVASERLAASGGVPRRQHTGGGPTQREKIQRDESPPSTEVDRRDKQDASPHASLASRPFAGPITKESQTRKHRGKR